MKSDAVLVERLTIEIKSGTASDSVFSVALKQWLTAICLNFFSMSVESQWQWFKSQTRSYLCVQLQPITNKKNRVQCSLPIRRDDISDSK